MYKQNSKAGGAIEGYVDYGFVDVLERTKSLFENFLLHGI